MIEIDISKYTTNIKQYTKYLLFDVVCMLFDVCLMFNVVYRRRNRILCSKHKRTKEVTKELKNLRRTKELKKYRTKELKKY